LTHRALAPRSSCAALAVVTMTALLAACTPSAKTAASQEPAPTTTTGSASTSAPGIASRVVAVPPVLDQSSVAGLIPHQSSTVDRSDQRSIASVSVPGDRSLDQALAALADADTRTYKARLSEGVNNELNIGWDPVLATGDVLGVRVATRIYTGGAHSTTTTATEYTDVSTGTTWSSAQLVSKPETLVTWVTQAVTAAGLDHATPETEAAEKDLRFGQDGSITIVLDQGTVGSEADGDVAVHIDSTAAASALNSNGQQVRLAAMAAKPFAGLPAPAPTPTPAPTSVAALPAAGQPPTTNVNCDQLRCVALTFDDGPGPYTDQLLSELTTKGVHATFFLVGRSVATRPDIVRREAAAGETLGNHTWDHPDLTAMSDAEIGDEVDRTSAAIKAATGFTPELVRPPYGSTNDTVASVLKARGQAQILWNVDTEDWKNLNVAVTTQRALDGARPGAIILMHDIHPTTVQAVPGIIDQLRARGYTLVTIPQLLGKVSPGQKYFSR
jgi:peptidoglycan-N-acetylglucosamine deacetylase